MIAIITPVAIPSIKGSIVVHIMDYFTAVQIFWPSIAASYQLSLKLLDVIILSPAE